MTQTDLEECLPLVCIRLTSSLPAAPLRAFRRETGFEGETGNENERCKGAMGIGAGQIRSGGGKG